MRNKLAGENAADQDRDPHFVRACAVEMHVDAAEETTLCEKSAGQMPQTKTADYTLCERAQSKMHLDVSQKAIFVREVSETCRGPRSIEMHLDISQEPPALCARIYK